MDRRSFTKLLGSVAIAYNSGLKALVSGDRIVVVGAGIVLKDTIIAIFIGNMHFPIEELYLYLLVGIVSVTATYVYQVNKKYY